MLSSANKSGPTIKQYIQPYFIEIAPDGVLLSYCARFNALLQKRGISDGYPGKNIAGVFSQLGHQHPALPGNFSKDRLDRSIDLCLYPAGGNQFTILWTLSPLPVTNERPETWQLTGVRIRPSVSSFDPPYDPPFDAPFDSFLHRNYTHNRLVNDILESITDGFFMLDKDFRVSLWNRESERITHLFREEMVGRSIWQKLPEWVGTETWVSFHRALHEKVTVTFEQYSERSDQWLEKSVYPSDEGLFVYFKDITVRKKQEMLLALEKNVLELNSDQNALLPAIVDHFLAGLEKIFPGMYCTVLTLNGDGSVKHLSAQALPAGFSSFIDGRMIGPDAGSCGTAMYRKERVIVSDIETDPLWVRGRAMALQFGLRACWSLPILNTQGEVLAAFAIYYGSPKSPAATELEIIERAANLLKIIIENKKAEEEIKSSHERYKVAAKELLKQELDKQKLVAQAMIDAQERERAEIGKELHDNINQILSTTKLYLELAKNNHKERLKLITRSAENIHDAIHEIRNISRSLVPSSIGDLGLLDSINDLVEGIKATGIIHVELHTSGPFDERISEKEKLMLFRIIQEQINNVLKHSGASNLVIELIMEETENGIELNITDDGNGFDPENPKNKKGLGLSNIMSRAGLFGGKVTILSAPGKGCTLRVQVPI
jgi:PAS domain S-box-containing protein